MSQAGRQFKSKEKDKMGYEDFVWFIMSEEDKASDMALEYWFKCCDLDGDGSLKANEMLVSPVMQGLATFVLIHSVWNCASCMLLCKA